jgi:hypothetical protein
MCLSPVVPKSTSGGPLSAKWTGIRWISLQRGLVAGILPEGRVSSEFVDRFLQPFEIVLHSPTLGRITTE